MISARQMSFLKSVSDSIRDIDSYVEAAVRAVSDGVLTDVEHAELRRIGNNLKLSHSQLLAANKRVVERYALWYIEDRFISDLEASKLQHLCKLLGVEWSSLDPVVLSQVNYCINLQRIAKGELPIVNLESLPVSVRASESVHFVANCAIYESRVVSRRSTGGFGGVRVRIAKGVSVGLGGFRGHSIPIKDNVCVSQGWLVLTNSHVRYFGSAKSFQKPWSKVSGTQVFEDGVVFHFSDRMNPSSLLFQDRSDPGVLEAILDHLLA